MRNMPQKISGGKSMAASSKLRFRAQEMYPVIERYLTSGLTQRAFCQQEGLSHSTLQWWLHKYRQDHGPLPERGVSTPERRGFVSLKVGSPASSGQCVIEYPNGVIVRLSGRLEGAFLRELIRASGE